MRAFLVFSFSVFFLKQLIGQAVPVAPPVIRATNLLERASFGTNISTPGTMIPTLPGVKNEWIGDQYLNKSWNKVAIELYNNKNLVEGYYGRLDLVHAEMDLMFDKGIKAIKADKIKTFTWQDSVSGKFTQFINIWEFDKSLSPVDGFVEVLEEGPVSLLRKTFAEIFYANYNEALMVGRIDNEIKLKSVFYYAKADGFGEVPKSMKKFLALFDEKGEQIKKFINNNGLTIQQEHHLKAIFNYYNSL